jgi:hypothetical protein
MDGVVAAEVTAAEIEVVPKLHEPTNWHLEIEDEPKVRTKLRLYTILIALYVSNTFSAVNAVINTP